MKHFVRFFLSLVIAVASFRAIAHGGEDPSELFPPPVSQWAEHPLDIDPASETLITILSTNDIHGGVEPARDKSGKVIGGMAHWGGVVRSIRAGLKKKYGTAAGTLLVDAGDQFQGTLISNYDEGQLVFATMDQIRYDMVIPGNHDYDFGPIDWLVDQPKHAGERRQALERILGQVRFPFASANTYFADRLVDLKGVPVKVSQRGCTPLEKGVEVDWSRAVRPSFLRPHSLSVVRGVRVAFIGIDNPKTHEMTTAANVEDLCFAGALDTYLRVRKSLVARQLADVFVLVVHEGDANNNQEMTRLARHLSEDENGKPLESPLVDAIVSGHTHFSYNLDINGIPVTQSGAGGARFGRIDLVWNRAKGKLDRSKTRSAGGVRLFHETCAPEASSFCQSGGKQHALRYEGVAVREDEGIAQLISKARVRIKAIAERPMGEAEVEVEKDRILESPLANQMTDHIRLLAGAEVAMINTGGLRENLPQGKITYEDLFRVFPFNNHALVIGPLKATALIRLLERSVHTCGIFGSLMQSGLRVTYSRDCTDAKQHGGLDPNSRLLHVETLKGEVLLDRESGVQPMESRIFDVVTFDFLRQGGEGFTELKDPSMKVKKEFGILREWLKDRYLREPGHWTGETDGRWKDID